MSSFGLEPEARRSLVECADVGLLENAGGEGKGNGFSCGEGIGGGTGEYARSKDKSSGGGMVSKYDTRNEWRSGRYRVQGRQNRRRLYQTTF